VVRYVDAVIVSQHSEREELTTYTWRVSASFFSLSLSAAFVALTLSLPSAGEIIRFTAPNARTFLAADFPPAILHSGEARDEVCGALLSVSLLPYGAGE